MRFASALAIAVAAIFMISAVPFVASSESYADPDPPSSYVDPDDKLNLCGYITGYDTTSSSAPKAYLFVVHKETESGTDVYYYTNVNDDPQDGSLIGESVDSNGMFSIVIPRINTTAEYYIWFDMYSIRTVPWTNAEKRTIVPDASWPSGVTGVYTAYKIPHEELWTNTTQYPSYDKEHPDDNRIWITDDDPSKTGLISLQRSMGEISGHVSIMVRGSQSNLEDVRVELFSDGKQVAYTNTDSKGNFSLEVPTGSYELTFNRGNYRHDPVPVEVIEGKNTIPEVTMELEMDNSYFGYDLVHFLMFIGAGICVLIIILSIGFQYKRMKMNRSGREWILDDMPEDDDE
ncbi:MAG: carboxypeptidase regulatory-like domain-containing protein [Candidatus Methanomethylophilaceae archaeon]|nr:carboxypeptidase regulatory-like domain-containing protein [Candidatus Methanomethylophilaceae archaeon]